MAEQISIDVPVFFPCMSEESWRKLADLRSSIDVIKNEKEATMDFYYEPSLSYDGLGEYARGERFPINATMVNVTTRSQNPLVNPLFVRAIPWQTVEFNGIVRCRFQPAESINGQVRVLVCESPQSLSPGNITSLMTGTQLSHSFGCTDTRPHTFRLFDGVKSYDNALNGMVTPGTVSFNELILNRDLRRQYNNRCDMFSIHLLYDSVIPAGGAMAENYFAEGAKIGTLTFTFEVNFLVARGSAYSFMLQDALYKIVQGKDIGTPEGGGSSVITFRQNPIPMTMQNMGQNGYLSMVRPNVVKGKAKKGQRGMLQVGKDVAVKDPYLRNLLFSPECDFTKAVLKQYNSLYAGGRQAGTPPSVSSLGGGDMLFSSTYSTGFAGVDKDGHLAEEEDKMVQTEALVSIYPHPGPTLEYIKEFMEVYEDNGEVDMSSLITPVDVVPMPTDITTVSVSKGKPSVKSNRYEINGALLELRENGLARINASGFVDNDKVGQAGDQTVPLAMGTSMIVPGSWARQQVDGKEVKEDPYYQYAMTGFAGGLHMDAVNDPVPIARMENTTVAFEYEGTNYTFIFGGDADGFNLYQTGIPAPEVAVPGTNGRKATGFLGALGSILSAGGAAIKQIVGKGRNSEDETRVCPLTRADFMSDWKKSTVGQIATLAGMVTGFLMGPKPAGMQYGIGEQEYDEKGRLMVCTFSAMFNNFIPVYVSAIMDKDVVDDIKDGDELPEHARWWKSLQGMHIDTNNGILCYTDDGNGELVPITFSEFFGEPKIVNAVTPLISRYPITSEHFSECSVVACPVGENTIISMPQKYFVSAGNNATGVKAGRYADTSLVTKAEDFNRDEQIDMVAQCNFISSTTGTVSFSFSLPERLPEMVDGEVVLTDLRVDDHFYVYFQIGSQIIFNGFSTKRLDANTTIISLIADGLTGKQPDLYTQEMGAETSIAPEVQVESADHAYACCPFLSLNGVKTTTSLASAENSTVEIAPPEGGEAEEA